MFELKYKMPLPLKYKQLKPDEYSRDRKKALKEIEDKKEVQMELGEYDEK